MTDLLVVGESLVDIVNTPGTHLVERPGGSPLNVAVGAGRLGVRTVLHTRIGGDEHGRAVMHHLDASDVQLTASSVDDGTTSTARASIHADGAADYEFDIDASLAPIGDAAGQARWIHTGSIAALLEPGASEVRRAFDRPAASAVRSFDPNVRAQIIGDPVARRREVEWYVARSDVLKVSDEDAESLYPHRSPMDTLHAWHAMGVRLAVLTCGGAGVHALFDGGELAVPARQVDVRDTIGAGDAFMAALIWQLIDECDPSGLRVEASVATRAVDAALLCAAMTVGREGADPPYLGEVAP